LKQQFAASNDFKLQLAANDKELSEALQTGNDEAVNKIVGERLKKIMEK